MKALVLGFDALDAVAATHESNYNTVTLTLPRAPMNGFKSRDRDGRRLVSTKNQGPRLRQLEYILS